MLFVSEILNIIHGNHFSLPVQENGISNVNQAIISNDHHFEEKVVQSIADQVQENCCHNGEEVEEPQWRKA